MTTAPKPQPPPLRKKSRVHSWGLAVANQLALPGLGTVLAGRKIGYVQLLLSAIGLTLTSAFIAWSVPNMGDWLNVPQDDQQILANFEKWKPWLAVAFAGIAIVAVSWIWALFSSRSILNDSAKSTR